MADPRVPSGSEPHGSERPDPPEVDASDDADAPTGGPGDRSQKIALLLMVALPFLLASLVLWVMRLVS